MTGPECITTVRQQLSCSRLARRTRDRTYIASSMRLDFFSISTDSPDSQVKLDMAIALVRPYRLKPAARGKVRQPQILPL